MKIDEAIKIIKSVKEKRVILFYSAGKDSMVLLDLMYPHFEEITCVFMYFVKDLEHINKYLNWTKARYPKINLIQVPHWNLTYILRNGLFCTPNPDIKLMKVSDVDDAIRTKTGLNYSFYGMKKADGLNRRLMLNTYENAISNTNKVYPLLNWSNKEIIAYMRMRKLPEPIRYSKKASGGVGFNPECYLYLQENYPNDLEKLLKAFPMSEKILYDNE